ncbi:MAG: cyclic 2,3-diphosphoglycerate synthase [Desulfurococcales archaeon]|nr:cyclic 2,3-diphosphoglycerate synthase [Desulfurococcales archaeon]
MERSTRVLILGAGGRDFHNFNVFFRDNPRYKVVAFTASQIPGIEGKRYPPELAGRLYPSGIPILPEDMLERIVKELEVDLVVLSYSDLTYSEVGEKLSRALASGASFMILGPEDTMLLSVKPVIAVTAVKTGSGKSTVSRAILEELSRRGLRVAPIRHPMAYGDLSKKAVMVISSESDLEKFDLTLEEREEYEEYVRRGYRVFSGIDYEKVVAEAEMHADVILWDGGNNDWPFIKPDYWITVADAMRPGLEASSFPGEVNARRADLVIINKADQAKKEDIEKIKNNIRKMNPRAEIAVARSVIHVDDPEAIKGRRVVVVEDAPTVTHGGAPYGAGFVAARLYGAGEIVDPRPYARGVIAEAYKTYKHMERVVPSMGYDKNQVRDLQETLRSVPAEVIVSSAPIDLTKIIDPGKPVVRVRYSLDIIEGPSVKEIVDAFLSKAPKYAEPA